jgi:hypothetical protein
MATKRLKPFGVFVRLCMSLFLPTPNFPKNYRDTGPKPKTFTASFKTFAERRLRARGFFEAI